jgi:hypothetical protein
MRSMIRLLFVFASISAGCGSKDPTVADGGGSVGGDAGSACDSDGPLLPMAVGNRWTYRMTHPMNDVSMKTNMVDKMELVGGTGPNANKMAFHVVTSKLTGLMTDTTESWQGVLADDTVVRYRELAYAAGTMQMNLEEFWDPYKLRVDGSAAHIVKGATWNEMYGETKIAKGVTAPVAARNDGWVVDDVDVPCGPVNGEMLSCIKMRKTRDGAMTGKTYWYARCVGKVREEGIGTEELVDYTVK